jgi:type VI secretion system protein ImpE
MTARQLYDAGKLNEAIQAVAAELRDHPTDVKRRTFLFELLSFAGDYDRALKHLDVLAKENKEANMGALLYVACLHSERTRQEMFAKKEFPAPGETKPLKGTFNGKPFEEFEDGDPRIGPRIEVFSAGAYIWIPVEHVISIQMEAPKRLRDLLWSPVIVRTGSGFKQADLGETLMPVLCPASYQSSDDNVRLGRATFWEELDGQSVPLGQKMFLIDGEEVPMLEMRSLEFDHPEAHEPAVDGAAD